MVVPIKLARTTLRMEVGIPVFSPPILSIFASSRDSLRPEGIIAARPTPRSGRRTYPFELVCAPLNLTGAPDYLDPVVVCFVRVLAEGRWWAADGQAFAVDEDRRGEHFEVSGRGMIQVLQHARAE